MNSSLLKGKKILIVDDYQINIKVISNLVEDVGAIPLSASNGQECVEIVKRQHVDIILMDYHMPVMNGIEATKAVRALPHGKKIIIIGISGSDTVNETETSYQSGMNLVVDKLALNDEKLIEISEQFLSNIPSLPEQKADSKHISYQTNLVMDYDKALKAFKNDDKLLFSIIEDFNRIIHSQLVLMKQAFNKSDFGYIQMEAHGIKGSAENLCALPLSEAAKLLEITCKQHADNETIKSLLEDLDDKIDSFEKFIQNKNIS